MRKVRVAQIGIGHDHAEGIFNTIKRQTDIFDIAGYAIPENEKQLYKEKLCHYEGYRELTVEEIMNDPGIEAVIIETEEKNLTGYSIMAAEHNKHIHMDKPGGMELSDFEKLISIVKEKNLIFHPGYMYRYNPEISRVIKEAERGELGEIFSVEANMGGIYPSTPEKRNWLSRFKGGMMFFLGCHIIDIVLSVMGEPENIIPLNKCTGLEGVNSEDFGMAVFEYKNGTSYVKNCSREVNASKRRQVVICGSEKTVEIRPLEYTVEGTMYADTVYSSSEGIVKNTSEGFLRYDGMMEGFAGLVSGEIPNPCRYDYELMLYKCVLKACGMNGNAVWYN